MQKSKKLASSAKQRFANNNAIDAAVDALKTSTTKNGIVKGTKLLAKESAKQKAGWDLPTHLQPLRHEFPEFFPAAMPSTQYYKQAAMPAVKALQTAYGVVAARDAIDGVTHSATEAVSKVPVLGEAVRVGEDLLQVAMNPWTTLATPLYAPYRIASGIVNEVTGRKEPIRPYDYRPTLGNVLDKVSNADIPLLSPAAKFLSFLS